MHQNAISIRISWYFAAFRWKSANVSRNQGVSRDSYVFWVIFRWGITVPSFITVWYVTYFRERGGFFATHLWATPQKPILNRVKRSPCFYMTIIGDFASQLKQSNFHTIVTHELFFPQVFSSGKVKISFYGVIFFIIW